MSIAAKYAFPHIEFNETIFGSVPQQTRWRATIGVAGQFRRGPQTFLVQDRQTFARLYGEDNSPGAKAVRQMLSLGATEIYISRAIVEPGIGTSKISFYNITSGLEAKIGYAGQVQQFNVGTPVYTTGLKLTLSFIGEAIGDPKSFGTINVLPVSTLNTDLEFEGQASFRLGVEDRLTNTIDVILDTPGMGSASKSYSAIASGTYVQAATGTLVDLNAALTPATSAVVSGETIVFSGGVKISTSGGNYTVVTGGSVAAAEQAFEVKNIPVTNVLARLDIGTKLYYNNAEVASVTAVKEATGAATTIEAITTNTSSITADSVLKAQAKIANATINAITGAADEYKYIKFSSSLYPAFAANLKPGRVLYSRTPGVVFDSGENYLIVMGMPTLDQSDNTVYNLLVKGTVTGSGLGSVNVALYDSPFNAYVLSSSFSGALKSKDYPDALQVRNKEFVQDRGVLVDTYHILPEAYSSGDFTLEVFFKDTDGSVKNIDSGLQFDFPAVGNSGFRAFLEGGVFQIPVVKTSVAVGELAGEGDFTVGTAASLVLKRLEEKIQQSALMNLLLDAPILSESLRPATLDLQTRIKGRQANRIHFELERSTTGEDTGNGVYANDLLFNSSNSVGSLANWSSAGNEVPKYFTGASDGSKAAFRDYYSADSDLLVRVIALSEGAYGNKIKLSINPIGLGQFTISAVDEDSSSYQSAPTVESLSLSTRDVDPTTGIFNATRNSSLFRAYYIPVLLGNNLLTDSELNKVPFRIAPAFGEGLPTLSTDSITGGISKYSPAYQGASYLQGLYLEQGKDAELSTDNNQGLVDGAALRKAVQRLEDQDVAILYPAGVVIGDSRYSGVIEEAIGQVNRATTSNGLRRLVLQAPPNLNQDQARLYSAQLNNKNVTLVAGHCAVLGISNSNTEHAAALYAATISLSSPQFSPAFLGNGVPVTLVRSVDTPNNPQYLDALTRAGVEALVYDSSLKTFKFLNGRTTSTISEERQVSIRRVADEIINNLYINLQPMRSGPNTSQLRALVSSSCDSYLSTLVADGWIQSYTPTICNDANNPLTTQVLNQLRIRINYVPIFPADIFLVDVVQSIVQELDVTLLN
jgi:hypothetical protein